jgi:alpha-1,6-mannosyltransferase
VTPKLRQLSKAAIIITAIMASVSGYIFLGYSATQSDFSEFILTHFLLFLLSFFLIKYIRNPQSIIVTGMFLRIIFLFSTPALSDDVFRYIWDGHLMTNHINPYLHTPASIMAQDFSADMVSSLNELYPNLNSPEYYSVYPPVSQFVFSLAAKFGAGNLGLSIFFIRIITLAAELGTLLLLPVLLNNLKIPVNKMGFYAFNPLVIYEISGNLHIEGLMIFFLLLGMIFYTASNYIKSALFMAVAVGIKLIPLIWVPFMMKHLVVKKQVTYFMIFTCSCLILFLPFILDSRFINMALGLNLYFQTFEFNASFYYGVRWITSYISGYNQIAVTGPLLAACSAILMIWYFIKAKITHPVTIPYLFIAVFTVYLLLATTVHPWYITPLVFLSVFTGYIFPVMWSVLVALSYSAYASNPVQESGWLIAIEYAVLLLFIWMDLSGKNATFLRKRFLQPLSKFLNNPETN